MNNEIIIKGAKEHNLKNISLNIKENLVKYISHFNLNEIKEKLYKNSIEYICIEDEEYPNKLRNIYNPPFNRTEQGRNRIQWRSLCPDESDRAHGRLRPNCRLHRHPSCGNQ